MIDTAENQEELNEKEKKYISLYKQKYGRQCYNIASGGNGGANVFMYASQEEKDNFSEKMTMINKKRCNSQEFKQKARERLIKKYSSQEEREKQRIKITKSWSNSKLREEQSKRLKKYYEEHEYDKTNHYKKCKLELNNQEIVFNSIGDLKKYLRENYHYTPDNRSLAKIFSDSEKGIAYMPFHKNKFKDLIGLKLFMIKNINAVETNGDECSRVGSEISTGSKDET